MSMTPRRRSGVHRSVALASMLMALAGVSTACASGFAGGGPAGACERVENDIALEIPGAPTEEAAIGEFVESLDGVLDSTTIRDDEIVYDDEVVGRFGVRESPAGGYHVEFAEWCYPG